MKLTSKILLILVFAFFSSNGQSIQSNNYSNYLSVGNRFNVNNENLQGSPFVPEERAAGYVIFKNGYKLDNIQLRYNAYIDNLEILVFNVEYIAKPDDIQEFEYQDPETNKKIYYKNLKLEKDENRLVEVLFDDGVTFIALNEKKRRRGQSSGSGYESLSPAKDELVLIPTYYLIREESISKVSRNERSIIKALGDHSKELSKFISENKLDIKKDEEDLVRFFKFYISLE